MNIAILGAPGCVGRHLIQKLLETQEYKVIASYREKQDAETLKHDRIEWRQVDLNDASSTENFLRGADVLIYLIHSLGAENFEQLDVQFAHSAGRAAQHVDIKKIIYLGGIIPPSGKVSPHLKSRMKTGEALASYGIPVGEVRASILLATCSASYLIVYYLAKRLPVMITPRWLNSLCAPIALDDAVSILDALISRPINGHEIFEIGSDIVRYHDLLALCGKAIHGIKNIIIPVPLFAIYMSALWIQLITGVPNTIGIALAEGLRSDTMPSNNRFREVTGRDPVSLELMLERLAEEMKKRKR
ncbi:MAG TPA: NAD(P)H-binding protein [Thermodesulfovibrionales bacterium]|nr:NAD(P)H-binding protein [Thermodesulfovibrionales bacterium]